MAKSPKHSNADPLFADDAQKLDLIRSLVAKSDKDFAGYQRKLHDALGSIFDLTQMLQKDERLESFVEHQGLAWGKVAQGNPFQPLTVLAFQDKAKPTAISKYARVLLYAKEAKPVGIGFADWVKQQGGIEDLAVLARGASVEPLDQFEETDDERYQRAITTLDEQTLGNLSVTTASPVNLAGSYGRALVRQINGKLEVVGIVPVGDDALKSDIFALVPPEAPLVRRKLQDKPYYELFRLCDVAARWFPKAEQADPVAETFGADTDRSPEDIVKAMQAAVTGKPAKPSKLLNSDRYTLRSGLRFRHSRGHWHADTVSTAPSFAVVTCKLEQPLPALDIKKQYLLHAAQVFRIANSFAEIADWGVRVRAQSPGGHDASDAGEIVFDDFTGDRAWRAAAKPAGQGSPFILSRAKLHACGVWFENFRALAKTANLGRLPKMMALSASSGIDLVVPSLNAPEQDDDQVSSARMLRQQTGRLAFAPTDALDGLNGDLADRYILRGDLLRLVQLSKDYGTDLNSEFLAFAEGIDALKVRTEYLTLTVPLTVSLSGATAGIADLV